MASDPSSRTWTNRVGPATGSPTSLCAIPEPAVVEVRPGVLDVLAPAEVPAR